MKPQVQMSGPSVGRSRIDDNTWEYFADPDESPEFFDHMSKKIEVQFLGGEPSIAEKTYEEAVWLAEGARHDEVVLEAADHARARSAKPYAKLSAVVTDRSDRSPGATTALLEQMWNGIAPRLAAGHHAILSGASGAEPATSEERDFLSHRAGVPVRATATHIGHAVEAQFPMNVALATLALSHGKLFAPADASGVEGPMEGPLTQVVVTGVGHWRGEGMALVEAVK